MEQNYVTYTLCGVNGLSLCKENKKLSYRRGTARRAVSVKTVLNIAEVFVE